ncbi:MAG: aldehyde dehydrogenase family protein [Thermoplasmatota archaeon]
MATVVPPGLLEGLGIGSTTPGACDGTTWMAGGAAHPAKTPIDGSTLATVRWADTAACDAIVAVLAQRFGRWRDTPAPARAAVVSRWGALLKENKEALGQIVTLETGKSLQEGLGEVQEMVDICEYAVGLGRTLGGKTLPSERPRHRLMEQWHPLGIVAVVTAFNFPVAVYAWNAALALVCGDALFWKPSPKAPISSLAAQRLLMAAFQAEGHPCVAGLAVGGSDVGRWLAADPRVALLSATGSCAMGEALAPVVAARHGRTILELGGNNAVIVAPTANLELAEKAVLFGAIGTAGQRCTSTRRLILHESIADAFTKRLVERYRRITIGNPLQAATMMGPLIDGEAVATYDRALERARREGGTLLCGGKRLPALGPTYVEPALVKAPPGNRLPLAHEETFAPILYLFSYRRFEDALALQNEVPQGLSSSLFTNDVGEMEVFLSAAGSDCGMANVNVGTSGAEIGGAFGGEKQTGGGREAGSDSWKQYMRRLTSAINYGHELPLAQGIQFGATPSAAPRPAPSPRREKGAPRRG